ncbi:hypothetical protein BC834DRAFT_872327 [Gloeopeniophorella convolvens]|nr:hypothetical protein BC834DRAFT_872327 [Gloeopeniophorella convolvens]
MAQDGRPNAESVSVGSIGLAPTTPSGEDLMPPSTPSQSDQSHRGSLDGTGEPRPHSFHSSTQEPRARPTLTTRRRISSPYTETNHPRGLSRTTTFQRVASELRRLTHAPDGQEWSVFSEVMAHEGTTPSRAWGSEAGSIPSLSTRLNRTTYLDGSPTHSPVSDPHLEEHFPSHGDESMSESGSDTGRYGINENSDTEPPPTSPAATIKQAPRYVSKTQSLMSRLPTLPTLYRNILKCSLAYFLGSLFTYYGPLSRFISELTQDGPGEKYPSATGHMVATVAVYYNPAKTLGGMLEADIYCLMGLGFASVISLGSMYTYWALEPHLGWEWLADILALMWIGVGMSLLAWFKLWIAKPTFNPAASMASIILFVVVVKEGGVETLLQVALIVAIGACLANLVCFIFWPQSATKNLQANMVKTLDSYSTLLSMLTSTFLLEDSYYQPSQEKISKAISDHQATFVGLKKNLAEARSEWLCGGPSGRSTKREGDPYEDAVDSLTRLAQHLNGLRSGTSLQYDLARAHQKGRFASRNEHAKGKGAAQGPEDTEEDIMLRAAAAMFGDLVEELGSPLRALSSTCTRAIRRLREAFSEQQASSDPDFVLDEFIGLADGIQRALHEFDSTSNHALLRLYNRSDVSGVTSRASITSIEDNSNPVLFGSDNEHVFLVYFFIFTLQEFARELISLTVAMSRIYAAERPEGSQGRLSRISSTVHSALGCLFRRRKAPDVQERQGGAPSSKSRRGLHRRISGLLGKEKSRIAFSFPKVRPHAPNTVQTPSHTGLSFWRRFQLSLWAFGGRLQDHDVKYGVKTGMATAILASPAFFESTRPTFMEYRGEWALISFFVVMSPTIGATNFLSVHRVLGTLFGATTAASAYTLFQETPAVLAVFGFFFSMPCFYYIVAKPQYATTGRFVLLTYNLTCLFCYNSRQTEISVIDVAIHRSTAVTVGVVWAGFVSRFWWPSEARRELSKQLGEFCLNVGWLYTRLVASNSYSPEYRMEVADPDSDSPNEETALVPRRLSNSIEEFMAMELHLQIKLIELQDLLKQTQHEPRLKGPFPIKLYRSILASLQTILDKLHSMRCVTTREEWNTSVRRDFIIPVNKERREMVGNIMLYFSTLGSAFRLKAPLPPYLPPAEKARQQLVEAIRKLDVIKNREIRGSRQLLFFAYALTMQGITRELDFLGQTSQNAFGVIGQSTEAFEAMFREDFPDGVVPV